MAFLDRIKKALGSTVEAAGYPAIAEVVESNDDNVIDLNERRHPQTKASWFGGNSPYSGAYIHAGEKFANGLPNSGMSPIIDHDTARINAREQYHVTPIARAMVERFAETVVDAGLKVEPIPSPVILGITREEATMWSRDVADRFHLWASSKEAHRAEQMTFYQMQRFAEISQQRDGEYFPRFHYDPDPARISPLCLEFLEPSQISGAAYTATVGIPFAGDGINRDKYGREVSYQVQTQDEQGRWRIETIPAVLPSGRRSMIHGWCPEYASQRRGYSPLTHCIQEFEQITQFSQAQIQKAIAQSALVMVKETEVGGIPSASLIADSAQNFAAQDGGTVPPKGREFGYEPMKVKWSPGGFGMFEGMNAGEKMKAFQNTAPSDSYQSFTDAFVSYLAASKSIPVEVLLLKFNSNYSASRAALVMFWRVALLWRKELESDFLNIVYEMWLSEEIAAGRVTALGWLDPILRRAWLGCEWTGSPMPNIDPEKSITASRAAIEANLSNFQREARDFNGSDAELNKAVNADFVKGMKPAPWVSQGGSGFGAPKPNPNPAPIPNMNKGEPDDQGSDSEE